MAAPVAMEPDPGVSTPLADLLRNEAANNPAARSLRDQPGQASWSGRPDRVWSAEEAQLAVARLAAHFAGLRLRPGALIGICLAGSNQLVLALLAAEAAGLTPFLLPLTGDWPGLARIIEGAGIQAVVTQGRAGSQRPGERITEIAAGYFRLRFLMAFGPDIPDGFADLDAVLAAPEPPASPEFPTARAKVLPGIVTLPRGLAERAPVFRPSTSLIAAAARLLVPARIRPGDRLISLITPDDLKGLALGPVAALLAGACLEVHGVFDAGALSDSLDEGGRSHLVVPGWMEASLDRLDLPASVETIILVHQVPVRFRAHSTLGRRVVDVLAFDEIALIANARTPGGLFALSLDPGLGSTTLAKLLAIRLDENAALSFQGAAAMIGEMQGAAFPDPDTLLQWHASCFKADLFAGIIIGCHETAIEPS